MIDFRSNDIGDIEAQSFENVLQKNIVRKMNYFYYLKFIH